MKSSRKLSPNQRMLKHSLRSCSVRTMSSVGAPTRCRRTADGSGDFSHHRNHGVGYCLSELVSAPNCALPTLPVGLDLAKCHRSGMLGDVVQKPAEVVFLGLGALFIPRCAQCFCHRSHPFRIVERTVFEQNTMFYYIYS
jgi:hypothetical protein